MGHFLLPGISWLIILLLVSPAISLIAVTLIVRGSAKAQSVEESQQSAVFLVIPDCTAGGGPVYGNTAAERLDSAGAGRGMCACGLAAPEKMHEAVHLRNAASVNTEHFHNKKKVLHGSFICLL